MEYIDFLKTKRNTAPSVGFDVSESAMNPRMFGWQKDIVRWALKKGRAALFEDCGLGKTIQQLEWSRHVSSHNPERVSHTPEEYPVSKWQKAASPVWEIFPSPVWWDIDPSATLNRDGAREDKDERHICPLQLPVIHRCLELWSNPGDVVLDPFDGIGSTGYEALRMGRRHLGIELKESYFRLAVENCRICEESAMDQMRLAEPDGAESVRKEAPHEPYAG